MAAPVTEIGSLMIRGVRPTDPPDVQVAERAAAALLRLRARADDAPTREILAHAAHLVCRHARDLADVTTALDAAKIERVRWLPGRRDGFDGELAPDTRVRRLCEELDSARNTIAQLRDDLRVAQREAV